MLAATYASHQVHAILTSNARDYAAFGCFVVITPGLSDHPRQRPFRNFVALPNSNLVFTPVNGRLRPER